ncbi:hypothetical protein E2C01_047931 [Portunus trituberculatus]|uniref:Uncharacterized protein n=1 Tax=Portunus trituberculatus TaxID=210409 RepID=A0A5B7G971_PORTR|nr:hypothetical protein [Portunus trituberculatus]
MKPRLMKRSSNHHKAKVVRPDVRTCGEPPRPARPNTPPFPSGGQTSPSPQNNALINTVVGVRL